MKRYGFVLFVLVALGFLLRIYKVDVFPSGFHADEAAFGYNAYSILKTGKDEYGVQFPLILKSFGDYKGALYSYTTIPFIAFLGLTQTAVRLPTVIAGTFLIALTFFLARLITDDKRIAFVTALLTAFSPLMILLSRVQSDPLMSVVFLLCGAYGWIRFAKFHRLIWAFVGGFFFVLSVMTNTLPRIFLFVFIPLTYWFIAVKLHTKKISHTIVLSVIILACVFYLQTGERGARFDQVSIFGKSDVTLTLQEKIREDGVAGVPVFAARVLHNKAVDFGRFFLRSVGEYVSPEFLLFQARLPTREQIPDMGVLSAAEAIFLCIGIIALIRKKTTWSAYLLMWIISVPIVLSFAVAESPNIHRFTLAVFPIHCIAGFGILQVFDSMKNSWKRNAFMSAVAILIFGCTVYFFHQLMVHQPIHQPFSRSFAYEPLVRRVFESYYGKYDVIAVTKTHESPYIHFLFYDAYDPVSYQRSGSHRDLDYQGFDKFIFIPLDCPMKDPMFLKKESARIREKILYIQSDRCPVDDNTKVLETIIWEDGSAAFRLAEYAATPSAFVTLSL